MEQIEFYKQIEILINPINDFLLQLNENQLTIFLDEIRGVAMNIHLYKEALKAVTITENEMGKDY